MDNLQDAVGCRVNYERHCCVFFLPKNDSVCWWTEPIDSHWYPQIEAPDVFRQCKPALGTWPLWWLIYQQVAWLFMPTFGWRAPALSHVMDQPPALNCVILSSLQLLESNHMKSYEIIWNHMKSYEIIWTLQILQSPRIFFAASFTFPNKNVWCCFVLPSTTEVASRSTWTVSSTSTWGIQVRDPLVPNSHWLVHENRRVGHKANQ